MERFVDLSLADIGRTAYRYRPVVAAFAAIVVLGLLLPGPRRVGQDLARYATGETVATVPATQTPAVATDDVPAGDATATPGTEPIAAAGSFDAASPSAFTTAGSSAHATGTETSSGAAAEDRSSSFTPVTSATPTPSSVSSSTKKATITTTLWASRTAGTPLADQGVPSGGLPIGKMVGQDDKLTFLRLSALPDRIVLAAHAEGQRSAETGAIQACLIETSGWQGGEAVAFDAAPTSDCTVAVQGVRADDGSWSFDLRPFAGRKGDGIALIPAPTAPIDFQVVLQPKLSS